MKKSAICCGVAVAALCGCTGTDPLEKQVDDMIELIAAASVIQSKKNWDWFNPGVGLTFTPFHTLQMYLFLDYISAIPLVDAKQFNISFGLNLLVGRSFDN